MTPRCLPLCAAALALVIASCRTPTERLDLGAAPDALTKNTLDAGTPATLPQPVLEPAKPQSLTVPPSRAETVPDVPLDEPADAPRP